MTVESVVEQLAAGRADRDVLRAALQFTGDAQAALFALARTRRDEAFPLRQAEVRSVIEISNECHQGCRYCRIGSASTRFLYTIGFETFVEIVDRLHARGRRHLLIQSGENRTQSYVEHVCRCLYEVRSRHPDLCLILNLGNLTRWQYLQLRNCGADRYILKFETSNPDLYARLKPRDQLGERLRCLHELAEVGFQVGSGNMVGLPGQTEDDLVNDLLLIRELPLTMGSSSAFVPGRGSEYQSHPAGSLDVTLNVMALMRIMNPQLLIPSTSSLEKAGHSCQLRGLLAGANSITIHDGTPDLLRPEYPIYSPDRFTPDEEHVHRVVAEAGLNLV